MKKLLSLSLFSTLLGLLFISSTYAHKEALQISQAKNITYNNIAYKPDADNIIIERAGLELGITVQKNPISHNGKTFVGKIVATSNSSQQITQVKYGYLYNLYAVNDARNIANDGWEVPQKQDMDTILYYLNNKIYFNKTLYLSGIAQIFTLVTDWSTFDSMVSQPGVSVDSTLYDFLIPNFYDESAPERDTYYAWLDINFPKIDGTYLQKELKSCRQVDSPLGGPCLTSEHPRWEEGVTSEIYGDNSLGFNVVPGGERNLDKNFYSIGEYSYYRVISPDDDLNTMVINNIFNDIQYRPYGTYVTRGQSIRLYRDATVQELLLPDGSSCSNYIGNDGKIYPTVKLYNKVFISNNLAETKYRNGDTIPTVTDGDERAGLSSGAKCAYNNDESNVLMQ